MAEERYLPAVTGSSFRLDVEVPTAGSSFVISHNYRDGSNREWYAAKRLYYEAMGHLFSSEPNPFSVCR